MARLATFMRKEAAEKEVVEEAAENEAEIEPVPSKEDDNDKEDQEAWP
jgi:hypothetical protein